MVERLTILFNRHLRQNLSEEEQVEFLGLCLEPSLQPELQKLVEAAWHTAGAEHGMAPGEKQGMLRKIFNKEETPVVDMTSL